MTGASGFLASGMIRRLSALDCEIVLLARGDLGKRESWERVLPGLGAVFHFAAQTSVYEAERDPEADRQANVLPMRKLLEACGESSAHPFIVFAGSATQCGLTERERIDESLPDRPVTAYDRHKLEAERLLEEAVRAGAARGCTLRLANVYGPGAARGSADRGILDRMMACAHRGEALTLHGEGAQLRDYLYVDDAIEAFVAAARFAERTDGRYFVVGSGDARSLADAFSIVARRAEMLTGRKAAVLRQPLPAGRSPIEGRSAIVDASCFRAATGWSPQVAFVDGVDRALAALQARSAEAA